MVVLNSLTHRTPCFRFVPLSYREKQARRDTSTGKPAHPVCLKLAQMSTRATVTDFFFLFKKKSVGNANPTFQNHFSSANAALQVKYRALLFLESERPGSAQANPDQDVFTVRTETPTAEQHEW